MRENSQPQIENRYPRMAHVIQNAGQRSITVNKKQQVVAYYSASTGASLKQQKAGNISQHSQYSKHANQVPTLDDMDTTNYMDISQIDDS